MTTIGILGRGAWAMALAASMAGRGHRVVFRHRGEGDLAGADLVLSAVPAQATRAVLAATALPPGVALVLTAKGLERGTLALQSDIAAAVAPGHPLAVLTGPSFAADLVAGRPVAVTLAMDHPEAEAVQALLATPSLRPYLTDDLVGAQIGGALKNVVAIACGAAFGAGLGESARAALIARGQAEMSRMALALGGRAATLAGLSGLGDLVLTAGSETSRNFVLGLRLGQGRTPAEAMADGRTYEGAATAGAAVTLARRVGVEAPIAEATAALIAGRIAIAEAAAALFTRPLQRE